MIFNNLLHSKSLIQRRKENKAFLRKERDQNTSIRKCSLRSTTSNDRDPLEIKLKNETRRILGKVFYELSLRPIKMFFARNKFGACQGSRLEMHLAFKKSIQPKSLLVILIRWRRRRREEVMSLLTLHGQSALHAIYTATSSSLSLAGNDKLSTSNVNYTRRATVPSRLRLWANDVALERFLSWEDPGPVTTDRSTNWHDSSTQTCLH